MNKFINKKTALLILPLVALFFVVPHAANAGTLDSVLNVVTNVITSSIEVFILPLAAGIMFLAGKLMDASIVFSLHTGYIFSLNPAINLGWLIVRDIANILFIFILIQISFKTIISGTGFGTKQMLTKVIIAAILINFTLFFTKALIDVGNVFGNWLYGGVEKTLAANTDGCSNFNTATGKCANGNTPVSFAALMTSRLGILNFWSSATSNTNGTAAGQIQTSLNDPSQGIIGRFLRLAVVLITTYIFIYIAILFISRSITLLFLLVFSPIAFMGSVLPEIKEYVSDWWSEFNSCLMFPIVFLLMLYIALQFINSLSTLNLSAGGQVYIFGMNVNMTQYFQYFLIIFMLKSVLSASEKYSPKLGKMMKGVANQVGQFALGASTGAAGFVMRRTIGMGASVLSENKYLQDMAAGKKGGNAFTRFTSQVAGEAAVKGLKGTASSSLDARGVLSGLAGVNLGKAQEGGFKGAAKALEEKKKKDAEEMFGDTKEGLERRLAYAEDRRRSWITRIAVGSKARGKIATAVRNEAGLGAAKTDTTDAQKELSEAKNRVVEEVTAQKTLDDAKKKATSEGQLDAVFKHEVERADFMIENSRNDPKKKLLWNRYDRSRTTDTAEQERLDKEFEKETEGMLKADKEALKAADNKDVADLAKLDGFVDSYKRKVHTAILTHGIDAKKQKIDIIKKASEDRVGEAPSDWDANAYYEKDGKIFKGQYKKKGEGLAKELSDKQIKIRELRREQAILEGKNPGNKAKEGVSIEVTGEERDRAQREMEEEEDEDNRNDEEEERLRDQLMDR